VVAADRNPTLEIEVPESLIIQSECNVIGMTAGINEDAVCSVEGRKIIIAGLFNESSAYELHSFRISDAVKNPDYKVDSIGTFVVKLFLDGKLSVQQSLHDAFYVKPGNLFNAAIRFDPNLNAVENPDLEFEFVTQHQLLQGSFILISIPLQDLSLNQR